MDDSEKPTKKYNYREMIDYLENIVGCFYQCVDDAKPHIGAPLSRHTQSQLEKKIREYLDENDPVLEDYLMNFCIHTRDLCKRLSKGDKVGAKTYLYHLESILEEIKEASTN